MTTTTTYDQNIKDLPTDATDGQCAYVWFPYQSGGWYVEFIFIAGRWQRSK